MLQLIASSVHTVLMSAFFRHGSPDEVTESGSSATRAIFVSHDLLIFLSRGNQFKGVLPAEAFLLFLGPVILSNASFQITYLTVSRFTQKIQKCLQFRNVIQSTES